MVSAARPLLVLHSHAGLAQPLRRMERNGYQVHRIDSWSALRACIREVPPIAIVIVDPYAEASDGEPAHALRSFLQDFGYVPVIAAMETRTKFRDLLMLARWGLSEVISLDQEAVDEALRQRLRSVAGWSLRSALERSIPTTVSGRAAAILLTVADVATAGGNTGDLAHALGVSPRTVSRWCAGAGLPPPRRLLAWMRLLLASEFLDDWKRKVFQVAHACGYASDNALRTAFGAFLERTPKQLRREGAFATVSKAFWSEVARRHADSAEAKSYAGQGLESAAPLSGKASDGPHRRGLVASGRRDERSCDGSGSGANSPVPRGSERTQPIQ